MGILDPSTYLGGTLKLDAGRSAKAVDRDHRRSRWRLSLTRPWPRWRRPTWNESREALRAEGSLAPDTVIAAFGGAGPMTICGAATPGRRATGDRAADRRRLQRLRHRLLRPVPALRAPSAGDRRRSGRRVAGQLSDRARRDMFAEGVELDDCERVVTGSCSTRNGDSVSVPLGELHDRWREHVHDGDAASLELSLVAPLPHVAIGATRRRSARGRHGLGYAHGPRPRRSTQRSARLHTRSTSRGGAGPTARQSIEGPFFTMRLPAGWRFQTTAAGDLLLNDLRSK